METICGYKLPYYAVLAIIVYTTGDLWRLIECLCGRQLLGTGVGESEPVALRLDHSTRMNELNWTKQTPVLELQLNLIRGLSI